MPAPEFDWKSYVVPARSVEGLPASPDGTAKIHIPNLTPWPGPLEKAHVLLQTAAEVEHALLVQYLYATYSLNLSLSDDKQHATVKSWYDSLSHIARQEMIHLMTVQNLLLSLGFLPTFEREDFPPHKDLYPFTLHLKPLTRESLAKYVIAESPINRDDIGDILSAAEVDEGGPVHHVGMIYGLLAFLFSGAMPGQTEPGPIDAVWDEMMQRIAAAIGMLDKDNSAAWQLSESTIDTTSVARQGTIADWPNDDITVRPIDSLESAYAAIKQVAEEGEGFPDGRQSHFSRFLDMFRGTDETLPFPAPGKWLPTLAVPTDPRTKDITEKPTQAWAELADLLYAMLLAEIEDYLRTTDHGRRRDLRAWAIHDMTTLGQLGASLTKLPLGDGVACLPFTMPPLPMPDTAAARAEVHRERRKAAIAKIAALPTDELLQGMLDDLTKRDSDASPTGQPRT